MADQLSTTWTRGVGVPPNTTPFVAANSTRVAASATPQAVKAAVAGKKHWITKVVFSNLATDAGFNSVADGSTKKIFASLASGGNAEVICEPPVEISAGAAINVYAETDAGDTIANVYGYVEN